ncbi:MAG: hypothetical protein ACRC33_04185 [Gemmataceae bacterium]
MRTSTRTATWARSEVLSVLLCVAVHRLADDPERVLRRVLGPGLANRLIAKLTFLALDGGGLCVARLVLAVDWDEHLRLGAAEGRLTLPGRPEDAAPELREMLASFERAVERGGLRTRISVGLRPGVDVRQARETLGLVPAKVPGWAGLPASTSFFVKKLPELEVVLELADEEE